MTRMTRFQALTLVTVLGTLVLIAVGSLVRTTGSGLGCPDWPLCHGGLLPPLERTAILEYSHRSMAAVVGLLIVATAITALRVRPGDRAVHALAVASLPLLAMQAWLGKITVERELPPEIVAFHLSTALLLLAIMALISAFAFQGTKRRPLQGPEHRTFRRLALLAAGATGAVVVLGAYTVSTHAGFGCTTWPGCEQAPIPFLDGYRLQHIHWLHRLTVLLGAAGVGGMLIYVHRMRRAGPWLRAGAYAAGALFALQIVSGALNIWSGFQEWARILHLVLGSSIWAIVVVLAVAGRYQPVTEEAEERPAAAARVEASGARA